jgi:hypothetical protein
MNVWWEMLEKYEKELDKYSSEADADESGEEEVPNRKKVRKVRNKHKAAEEPPKLETVKAEPKKAAKKDQEAPERKSSWNPMNWFG